MPTSYAIRTATTADQDGLLPLLPRLAAFDLPESRVPEDLWKSDEKLLRRWLAGQAPECIVQIAVDPAETVLGLALVSLRPELLSNQPSAHLEALAVAAEAEGQGIGKALLHAVEQAARDRGALTMTLHVFASNSRARHVYERAGYTGQLIRYTKAI